MPVQLYRSSLSTGDGVADTRHKGRLKRDLHIMPDFMRRALEDGGAMDLYAARPAYQQNDYIWWISSAKREATKAKRLEQMLEELRKGDVYMGMRWKPKAG